MHTVSNISEQADSSDRETVGGQNQAEYRQDSHQVTEISRHRTVAQDCRHQSASH